MKRVTNRQNRAATGGLCGPTCWGYEEWPHPGNFASRSKVGHEQLPLWCKCSGTKLFAAFAWASCWLAVAGGASPVLGGAAPLANHHAKAILCSQQLLSDSLEAM